MRRSLPGALGLVLALAPCGAYGYPLDAYKSTGITRLEAYRRVVKAGGAQELIPPGSRYPSSTVRLWLADRPDFRIPPPDAGFGAEIRDLLGADARAYGVTVLDLTDPAHPRYAELNAGMVLNPGSVGKILIGLGMFQALADTYPDDVAARQALLRDTVATADGFIRTDTHEVPFWKPGEPRVVRRPIEEGDAATLNTWLDWMLSASSNAAGSMVLREVMLLGHFGKEYPVPAARGQAYFTGTAKGQLHRDLAQVLEAPVRRNGLDLGKLRQGSFFTREGKQRVPGSSSYATSRALLEFLVAMEQGRLVDAYSSLELKRFLYLTDGRVRYAASPALADAAVYYKSGSLYGCRPEPGFACGKYRGNVRNFLSSVAIVETPERAVPLHYMAVVMSNVLRKDSAEAHQALAARIHHLMEAAHPVPTVPSATR